METHKRTKVELVVEISYVETILKLVESIGAKGYTMIPHVSGKGHHGTRGAIEGINIFENVMIIVITDNQKAHAILEQALEILKDGVGIGYLSSVDVLRANHF